MMEPLTVNDFLDLCEEKRQSGPFKAMLGEDELYGPYTDTVDGLLSLRYGERLMHSMRCADGTDRDVWLSKVLKNIGIAFESFRYKYKTLIETVTVEYDPIENFNGMEEETTIRGGYDGTENPTVYKNKTKSGERNVTSTVGETSTTVNYGAATVTDKVSPDASENWRNKNQSSSMPHADDTITDARTDTQKADAAEDVAELDPTITVHKLKRHGNLGVTTTQQMLKSSREDIANFSIADEMAKDFVHLFCLTLWSHC